MKVRDSRRLTGPNVLWEHPGAVLDLVLEEGDDGARAVQVWERWVKHYLDAVGWQKETIAHRLFPGGLSLALSAPMDALYAATEINEAAWASASAELTGEVPADSGTVASENTVERLSKEIRDEANPALEPLRQAARERGVYCLSDDDDVSVGAGIGSQTWAARSLPSPGEIDWEKVHDVPVALVTGTNGKTTTVRLLAAMVEAAGKVPGVSSTDWIRVGSVTLDTGDYSGPGGARSILRDQRTEAAILETARGRMLRRGLAVPRADVALITNVAEDHLGEFGILDLAMLAETKFVVRHAAERMVINADDPLCVELAQSLHQPVTYFSLDPDNKTLRAHLDDGGEGIFLQGGSLIHASAEGLERVAKVEDIPITLEGAARHNVANALGAIAVARALGLDSAAIRIGLEDFESSPEANPGRLNRFDFGGLQVLVDFAHNPHGVEALLDMTASLKAERRLVVVGQAGDREDEALRQLADQVADAGPDRVVIKEMVDHLRGRKPGEIPALLRGQLSARGMAEEAIEVASSEIEAMRLALAWARPGDLLLLLTHAQRGEVLDLMQRLTADAWVPGSPIP